MYSSIFFNRFTSKIHYWEYNDEGKKEHKESAAPLYFYVKDDKGEYTSIFGDKLKKITFDSFSKYKETKDMYKSANREMFESDIDPESRFVLDNYSGKDLKTPDFDVHFIDIEVHSEKGFPKPETAEHPITIITVYSTKHKKWFIWAEKEFDLNFKIKVSKGKTEEEDIYSTFADLKPFVKICPEKEMIQSFVSFIRKVHPDFLSGWNSSGFDIPYIINRGNKLLGEEFMKNLSPIKHVKKIVRKLRFGKTQEIYEIAGINSIDYLYLYKKYVPGEKESFKLGHIAREEIDETKLEYEGTLKDLYRNNWQKYCEYNIQDVNLLFLLDTRLKYINLMVGICYNCRVLFEEFDKTTKVLDGAFISRLLLDKIILPDIKHDHDDSPYEGAYVKEPKPGMYDWVMCFDATSLYPSVMMQHNMSPETKVYVVQQEEADIISKVLNGEIECPNEYTSLNKSYKNLISEIKENNYTIASNGAIYRHDISGVVSRFVKEWFDNRVKHKNLMKKASKEGNHAEEQYQDGLQYTYKILINSVYGYLGSKYSRLYDKDNALAVTVTGQYAIKSVEKEIQSFFTEKWETTEIGKKISAKNLEETPAIYFDTDSCYVHVGQILRSFNYPHINDQQKCLEFVQTKMEPLLQKIITNEMEKFTKIRMNTKECKISFKREMIAKNTIFLAKKRYVAHILDMEGKLIKEGDDHEVEAKGLEIVRSSTPEVVRKWMKEAITLMLKTKSVDVVNEKIKDIQKMFKNGNISNIAKIMNVNNIEEYTDSSGKPALGCPGQVKAAIGHNLLIESNGLEDEIEKIYEGDKVKIVYIKDNPYYKFNQLAFKDNLPEKFNMANFVDYDIMWEKVFMEPMISIYDVLKWKVPNLEQEDITDLFS